MPYIGTCFRFYMQMRVQKNNKAFAYRIYSHFTQQCGLAQKQKLCSTVSRARKCCCFYLGYFICKQLKFTKRVHTSDFSIQSCFVIFFVPLQFQNVKVKTDRILTMKRKKTRLAIHEVCN